MIRVDSRIGSGELTGLFKPYGINVEKTHLEYGDFDFEGKGPNGLCSVVFERKRIEDLVACMQDFRLAGHQLPGISENYDYGYLIIEGIWRPDSNGFLEIGDRGSWRGNGIHTRSITNFVMGLTLRAGLIPWRTSTQKETVGFIVDQYRMWNEKAWEEHKSHDVVYAPAESGSLGLFLKRRPVSLAEKLAMQLPGIDDKARYIARHFKNARQMFNAEVEEWASVPWQTRSGKFRLLGSAIAKKVVGAITS
jgi:ERCC4-type nuclease